MKTLLNKEDNDKDFLQELYDNETKYPYITKIYDSKDDGYSYQIKIFEINYEIFSLQNVEQILDLQRALYCQTWRTDRIFTKARY